MTSVLVNQTSDSELKQKAQEINKVNYWLNLTLINMHEANFRETQTILFEFFLSGCRWRFRWVQRKGLLFFLRLLLHQFVAFACRGRGSVVENLWGRNLPLHGLQHLVQVEEQRLCSFRTLPPESRVYSMYPLQEGDQQQVQLQGPHQPDPRGSRKTAGRKIRTNFVESSDITRVYAAAVVFMILRQIKIPAQSISVNCWKSWEVKYEVGFLLYSVKFFLAFSSSYILSPRSSTAGLCLSCVTVKAQGACHCAALLDLGFSCRKPQCNETRCHGLLFPYCPPASSSSICSAFRCRVLWLKAAPSCHPGRQQPVHHLQPALQEHDDREAAL